MSSLPRTTEQLFISLTEQREAILTMPWFVEDGKHPPRPFTHIDPLINGERAFRAVYQAIAAAKSSVEIISWGFDPSMRPCPPDGRRMGDLLLEKAAQGVKIRILVWKNALANFGENNIIGDGLFGSGGGSAGIGSGMGSTSAGGASGSKRPPGDNNYGNKVANSAAVQSYDSEARAYTRRWFSHLPDNIAFMTRDYMTHDRVAIALDQQYMHPDDFASFRSMTLTTFPSHHQKTLLVDYEIPKKAVGFVMGHNLLRNYWDDDTHAYHSTSRLGFGPWQDISCRVRGPILYDLNLNFQTAWARAQPWLRPRALPFDAKRAVITPMEFATAEPGEMAQITRTQSQDGDKSILGSYHLALSHARNYVYFENQYFRYKDFALQLRALRRKLKAFGWPRDFYVFVVTNVPDDSGRLNTYEMLAALGKANNMPKIHKKRTAKGPQTKDTLRASDLDGLHVHVCTLASDSGTPPPAGQSRYKPIYVHSKLMLVDDVFFTLGSANINVRSMEVDSELCIACPSERVTRRFREHLWRIHTGREPLENIGDEFDISQIHGTRARLSPFRILCRVDGA